MNFLKSNRQGQATLELAIYSSVFLVVLGVLLSIGQSINHQIDVEVDAYILALERARLNDGPVSYVILRDKRLGGISESFKDLNRTTFSGSASVLWAKFLAEPPKLRPRIYYQVNDDIIDMGIHRRRLGKDKEDYYPSVWDIAMNVTTNYSASENTRENPSLRTERDTATLRQYISRTMQTRYYDRQKGIDVPGPTITITQGIYPKTSTTEGYKVGGSGVRWQRTRNWVK